MPSRPQKVAYYCPGNDGDLEQPIVYGLKSLGYEVLLWQGEEQAIPITPNALYIFLARTIWSVQDKQQVKNLLAAQAACFIASPCKHDIDDNPCLKQALNLFGEQVPIIYPPYDAAHLARQLGIITDLPMHQVNHINQVLLVDDSPSMLAVLEHYVQDLGLPCYATTSPSDALQKVQSGAYDILISDYQMDEMNGIELIKKSKEIFSDIKSILVTSFGDKKIVLEAISTNVEAFIEKPVDLETLQSTLTRLEKTINMRKENSRLLVKLTETNASLKEGKDTLHNTLECLNEAVLTINSQFNILSANNAITELTQHKIDSILNKQVTFLIAEKTWQELYEKCMDLQSGVSLEGLVSRVDGDSFPARLTLKRSHKVLREVYILVIQDITSQKSVENNLLSINEALESKVIERTQKIEDAMQEAERANKAKSEFLANMSHELRTPMHAIMSFNSLIDKDVLSESVPETVREKVQGFTLRISESSKRLLKLINNLLDISKLETGHADLQKNTFNMLQVIESVKSDLSPLLEEKNINIEVDCQVKEAKTNADDEKITQVMLNLLSNACKFSPQGSTIKIDLKASEVNVDVRGTTPYFVPSLEVSVLDQGVGIPEGEIHSIFDKFIQSSKTKTGAGGTGLGLAICKEIIDLHRGKICAMNNSDGGACFTFNLPVSAIIWRNMPATSGARDER